VTAVQATGTWDLARRRWQVLAVGVETGVSIALLATTVADSSRPLRDILIGLTVGFVLGLSLMTPVDHSARQPTGRTRRHRRYRRRTVHADPAAARRAQQPALVSFPATPWPHPELTEKPTPTFAPPGRL
jgi:hypothetical protein